MEELHVKKILIAILTIATVLAGTACSEKSTGKESTTVSSSSSSATATTTAEPTFLSGMFSDKDLVFPYEGQEFGLLSDVTVLLTAVGEGYVETAAPSCTFEGEDKNFKYTGLEIMTNPIDGKDLINEIVVTSSDFVSPRGIKVGDPEDAVIAAYGEGYDDQGVRTYVVSGDFEDYESDRMFISIKDGKVEYISYFSGVSFR